MLSENHRYYSNYLLASMLRIKSQKGIDEWNQKIDVWLEACLRVHKIHFLTEPSVETTNTLGYFQRLITVKRKLGFGDVEHGIDTLLRMVMGAIGVQCKFRTLEAEKYTGQRTNWPI